MQATLSRNDFLPPPSEGNLDGPRDEGRSVDSGRSSNSWIVPALASAIVEEGLSEEFPDLAEDDLVLRVYLHWEDLVAGGAISVLPREVVLDYGSRFASTENSRFHFRLRKRLP